ncbi:MAG: 4-hydroxyphenylacetate 3-hydroxylase N-terminal domain-containing protein, partial [Solimonas sp.]
MIRTGAQYKDSIRDNREIYINGEQVKDVTVHPMFKPLVDIRARIYYMQHDPSTKSTMTYKDEAGEEFAVGLKLPHTQDDWHAKRKATDAVLNDVGGIVTRVGDETVGEMWSLYDGQDVLNELDPR